VTPHLGSLGLAAFAELCEGLPGVLACAKGTDGCYVYANREFAERAGRRTVAEVIGRTVHDLFEPEVAASVEAQDHEVLATGRPLQNHLEAIVAGDGTAGWWATSKARFLADDGSVLGIVCLSVALAPLRPHADETQQGLAEMLKALKAAPGEQWRVADMCDASGLTRQQLERTVQQSFNLAPTQLLLRVRIEEAMHMLSHGDYTLADIAARCGFYDQSNFTRQFRASTGVTPGTYRALHPYRLNR
jgi:AraC-like DNA-binding protein